MNNITENNKLLAEFLGWGKFETFEGSEEYVLTEVKPLNLKVGDFNIFGLREMKFNTSWDWLMEVVDKIESLIVDGDNSFNVTIGSTNYCVIQDSHGELYEGVEDYGEDKLATTYKACIEFVKWYNDNK